jgi:hypothetical protein
MRRPFSVVPRMLCTLTQLQEGNAIREGGREGGRKEGRREEREEEREGREGGRKEGL